MNTTTEQPSTNTEHADYTAPLSPEEILALLEDDDKVHFVCEERDPVEWFRPEAIAVLATVRADATQWGRVSAVAKLRGVDTWNLRLAVDAWCAQHRDPVPLGTSRIVVQSLAEVTPTEVQWLWWPYIMEGGLCMLDGDPGQGKSLLTLALASILSRGGMLPDQQGIPSQPCPQGSSLFFATEDDLGNTILPRVQAAGGDVHAIRFFMGVESQPGGALRRFTLHDLAYLQEALRVHTPRLVVLDPIQSYLGSKVDINRANETRQLLEPLAALARAFHTSIILVRHAAKGGGDGNGLAMMRGLGSVDLVAAARTALYVEQHPGDENLSLLCHTKGNVSRKGRTLLYSKQDGVFAWAGVTRITAEDIAGSGRGPNPRERIEVALWLEKRLNSHPQCVTDLELEAEKEGFTPNMLKKVKKMLRVASKKMPGDEAPWTWKLDTLAIIHQPPPRRERVENNPYSSLTTTTSSPDTSTPLTRGGERVENTPPYLLTTTTSSPHTNTPLAKSTPYEDISEHATNRREFQDPQQVEGEPYAHVYVAHANTQQNERSQVINKHICLCGGTILKLAAGRQCIRCNNVYP